MIKKRVAHSFALLLGMLLGGFASAQAEQLAVKTYTSADGLGSSFISSLMRDSHGFLWASTRDGRILQAAAKQCRSGVAQVDVTNGSAHRTVAGT